MKITTENLQNAGYTDKDIKKFFRLIQVKKSRNLTINERHFYNKCQKDAAICVKNDEKVKKMRVNRVRPVETKQHYRWVEAEYNAATECSTLGPGEVSALKIFFEEELLALKKYQPVLSQIDTTKRHKFNKSQRDLLTFASEVGYVAPFDFEARHNFLRRELSDVWNEKWTYNPDESHEYIINAIIPQEFETEFRQLVRTEVEKLTREVYPSVNV